MKTIEVVWNKNPSNKMIIEKLDDRKGFVQITIEHSAGVINLTLEEETLYKISDFLRYGTTNDQSDGTGIVLEG